MSARFRLETTSRRVEREIARLPRADREQVIAAIRQLAEEPRPQGIKQLEPNVYRLRVGDLRVIYKVLDAEQIILIGRVTRRSKSTYREWRRLFK